MKFLSFFFIALPLFATQIMNYNLYERDSRVDLTLIFDKAYTEQIFQERQGNFVLLKFNGLSIAKEESKELDSDIVKKILITPSDKNQTHIMLELAKDAQTSFAFVDNNKTSIRIRTSLKSQAPFLNTNTLAIQNENNLSIKGKNSSLEGFDLSQYILILSVLLALLVLLYIIKKQFELKNNINAKDFKIIFQRALDKNNKFLILEYAHKRYTMIIGSSNLLLETQALTDKDVKNQELKDKEKNFDSFFEENKKRLQKLISKKTP